MTTLAIARGDIWRFALDPGTGSEEAKTRPCVIVQRNSANKSSSTTIICPLTTAGRERGNLLNVFLRAPEAGIVADSLVLCNQLRAVDRSRIRGHKLGVVGDASMLLIEEGIRTILDLDE